MGHRFSRVMVALAFLAAITSIAFGGPNKTAELFIDCSPSTSAIDSIGKCFAESSFTTGVFIRNASKVYSYQYSISYDTSRLRFVKAMKGSADCQNFLEAKGQSMSFKGTKGSADSTRILIAGWLTGDDTSQCVGGTGCLSLVTFSKRFADTASLSLTKVIIIDCNLVEDTACVVHGATVLPGTMGVARFARTGGVKQERVEYANGKVRIVMPLGGSDFRAALSDVSGREILRFPQGKTVMEADLKSMARGLYFVSIVRSNRISSYPLANGR